MKKTIGICLFAALLFAGILFGFLRWEQHKDRAPQQIQLAESTEAAPDTAQPETTESMTVQEPYRYILREKDGVVVVYEEDGTTILLETNISVKHVDEATQKLLVDGIQISDEQELYALLESYSS